MHDTRPAHLISHDFVTIIIFGEAYMLQNLSLYSILQTSPPSSVLGQNILLSTLFLNTLKVFPLLWQTKFHSRAKQQVYFCVC
jgi:hypothetical protein